MGRNLTPRTPNSPPTKGTQEECFPRKMAAHTVIQLRVAMNPKIGKKSKLGIQEVGLLGTGIHIPKKISAICKPV
jgi:hypothetical protein